MKSLATGDGFGVGLCTCKLFPTFGVGLLDFNLNSSPRPELFSSPGLLPGVPNPRFLWSAQPVNESPWSAQPQSLPGVPPRFCLECQPRNAQPRVSLECPNCLECPSPRDSLKCQRLLSAQPQKLLECPAPWSAQPHLQAKTKKAYLNQCVFV